LLHNITITKPIDVGNKQHVKLFKVSCLAHIMEQKVISVLSDIEQKTDVQVEPG
jgi:hypothetical protein